MAVAVINRPRLLLADEPTGNLDPENSEVILNFLDELRETYNMSLVVVTHSQQVASRADRTLEINNGIIMGTHEANVHLHDLDKSRILELDNQNRLPIPDTILKEVNNERRFVVKVANGNIILQPASQVSFEQESYKSFCPVCGKEKPVNATFCPHCGASL